jgi:3-methyladenine DNA glycosylase AlkD
MIQHHKYSLAEIENMMPWERRIYIELLLQHLKEEKERMEAERMSQ